MITDNEFYYWSTEDTLATNQNTMSDFLEHELEDGYEVTLIDGSYAEITESASGFYWAVHAVGDGEFCHHKVQFDAIGFRS